MTKKKIYFTFTMLCIWTMLPGCSVFISTPQVALYHVQDLNNQLNEFMVPIDTPNEGNMDIHLSDRYAVQFDFEWLWNTDADMAAAATSSEACTAPSLAPWMVCKYRF